MQQLNKHFYKKCEKLVSIVYGRRIEDCITIYSDYQDKSGAVSCIIGKTPTVPAPIETDDSEPQQVVKTKEELIQDLIAKFLSQHVLFKQKYEYGGMVWPCCENKSLQIAVFKFKHERKIKLKAFKFFY